MSYSLMQRFEINRVQRSDKTTMKCGLQLFIEVASINPSSYSNIDS